VKTLSIDESDLLNFFETIPDRPDPDEPWLYDDSSYEASDAHVRISFGVTPWTRFVTVILRTSSEAIVYKLIAKEVDDVRYHNDKGRESLEVVVSAGESIWIRIKPAISVNHTVAEPE
jgi:hypothetical protein